MKKLIINADDFGYSRSVNYGIIDAHQLGILTSTTLMTNMPGAGHAAELAKANPSLGVGVHLVLTCGKPLLKHHKTIADMNGNFRRLDYYKGAFTIDLDEVYEEWKAQIEKFLSFGLIPTHLDSHHHIHSFGNIPEVFLTLAKEYRLPVRGNMPKDWMDTARQKGIKTTDYFCYQIETVLKDHTLEQLFENYDSIEIMTHPAYLDKSVIANSSYAYPRVDELEMLIHPELVRKVKSFTDIKLATYRDI
ncbi:chitin disaccharide deacetylase [Caldibacillus debilis]|uniref:chitin disaccharide deacetylase n=1 Tax=Caldibacillus debilis TaxID=301148 RepID=UPI000361C74F|nr:chitin disaccharide deacetylase [Caldibacillus debilis]